MNMKCMANHNVSGQPVSIFDFAFSFFLKLFPRAFPLLFAKEKERIIYLTPSQPGKNRFNPI